MIEFIEKQIARLKEELQFRRLAKESFLSIVDHFNTDNSKREPLELFFYAQELSNANELKDELIKLLETVDLTKSGNKWLILGQKLHIDLNSPEFDSLIVKASELAFIYNCQFDGWGLGIHLDNEG